MNITNKYLLRIKIPLLEQWQCLLEFLRLQQTKRITRRNVGKNEESIAITTRQFIRLRKPMRLKTVRF